MDATDLETALAITPRFYPAALDFELWPGVLEEMAVAFGARVAQVNLIDMRTPDIVATVVHGAPDGLLAAYLALENHFEADPRLVKSLELPNRPICERQFMSVAAWRSTRMYREVMAPFGFDSALGTYVLVTFDANIGG